MAKSSRIETLLRSLKELGEPVRSHGASFTARALVIARLAAESPSPLVVLCSSNDSASELAHDIETLSETVLDQEIGVCLFPGWEQPLYSPIAPSLKTRLERIGTLSQIARRTCRKVIITTLEAAAQVTLPQAVLDLITISLKLEESVESREALIRQLLEAGYMRVDPVEDPGTFAVRGDIVDIFPSDAERPYRVELFGDLVERIRSFDPASQRAATDAAALKTLSIPPAREVLINALTSSGLRERLKARADDLGIPRTVRDPILESLQSGTYPEHADAWGAFAYETPADFWDYIPTDWPLIWNDELDCQQEWDQVQADQAKLAKEAQEASLILPAIEATYPWNSAKERALKERSKLYLDRLELTEASTVHAQGEELEVLGPEEDDQRVSARHRFFVRANSDLVTGSRHSLGDLEPKFQLWLKQGFRMLALASTQSQAERVRFLLEERGLVCRIGGLPEPRLITIRTGSVGEGFRWPAEGLVVLTESEILGTRHVKKQRRASRESGSAAKDWSGLQALADLSVGDLVVHIDHGIGRYQGLVRLDLSGAPSDFLLLEYANKDKLYLPVYRLNVIQKYVGSGDNAMLDRLGSQQFLKAKEKVKDAVKKLAFDLVQLYAERKIRPGIRFTPPDGLYQEFEAKFPFDETPDQSKAIDDTLDDLQSGKVMDRLVCGDVGYGKTEVAIRAAFKAVSDGKQVVVLVPTTVLAHQHEQSFRLRMKDYPIRIESVSRFKSTKDQKAVLEQVKEGKVDIIIGTHRLLSRDVSFRDLGLVIVDEEHRFGVEHKEKLKTLKVNTHVLTLTATPIPRTLHMALAGLRDISLINTPPVDRLPIRTYVSKYDDHLIKQAIEVELSRGGQVFFVHNRVQSIFEIANRIREMVPHALVGVGHGQMGEGELEQAMVSFYHKQTNVLVCTSIIESGLDLPSANTILVNRADMFGLAQLYQIRGRVGRGQARAYAYLLLPAEGAITEDAKKRLEVIQRFVELGSGFSIASHDLEIRGGGDLLGPQQSGHIAAVGFDLYTELLEEAIAELRGQPMAPEESSREPEIKTPFPAFLSEEYIPDVHQRLSIYRRLSASYRDEELNALEEELKDRYGPPPAEAQSLLWLIRIKQILKQVGIDTLTVGKEKVSLVPGPGSKLDPARAIALVSSRPSLYQLTPDSKFVAKLPAGSLRDLYFGLETLFKDLLPRNA